MPKTFSGRRVIAILCKQFGCTYVATRGSHVKLTRVVNGKTLFTVVPLHRELARGTLRSALRLVDVPFDAFFKYR